MNLDDYTLSKRNKVMVYGPPKSGKTALVGKLASRFKLHWMDLEQGVKTLLNPAILKPEYRKNVNIINVPDHRMYPVAIDTVRDVLRGGNKRICYDHGKTNCPLCLKRGEAKWSEINILEFGADDILVIDSTTQLANSAMNKFILKEISKPNGEEYKRTFTDYAGQGAFMEQVLSLVQVLDINICCISHEIDSEKAESKEKLVPVAGTRNFSLTVAKYFDTVVYTSVLNKSHRANCSSTFAPNVVTGSRLPVDIDNLKGDELSLESLFLPT